MPRTPKNPAVFSESLHHLLNSYALAASAAGVGMLALASPAQAKIIYRPTHRVIGDYHTYNLDLNGDGKTDLTIKNEFHINCSTGGGCSSLQALSVGMAGKNEVVYNTFGAAALTSGRWVDPKSPFHRGDEVMARVGSSTSFGNWRNVTDRYLGLKFRIKGKTHYGWARLSVIVSHESRVRVAFQSYITATLTGYAYETIPNKPIIAGKTKGPDVITVQPGSVGTLAAGRR
jgi:hypothetical protein